MSTAYATIRSLVVGVANPTSLPLLEVVKKAARTLGVQLVTFGRPERS